MSCFDGSRICLFCLWANDRMMRPDHWIIFEYKWVQMSGNCQVDVKHCCGSQWFPLQIYLSFYSQFFLAILYFCQEFQSGNRPHLEYTLTGSCTSISETYILSIREDLTQWHSVQIKVWKPDLVIGIRRLFWRKIRRTREGKLTTHFNFPKSGFWEKISTLICPVNKKLLKLGKYPMRTSFPTI